jgi:PAS domain-containing protein
MPCVRKRSCITGPSPCATGTGIRSKPWPGPRLLYIGKHACVLTVFRDISEQLRLERAERTAAEAQRISEAMFSAAFHCSPDYITISRLADGTILEVNQAFIQLVGWSRERPSAPPP